MQPVVTADEMRSCDEAAIRTYRMPGILLMEHAGTAVAQSLAARFGPVEGKRVLVFCGKGNNGGDGYVVARQLLNRGATVDVVSFAPAAQIKGDARVNFDILLTMAKRGSGERLRLLRFSTGTMQKLRKPDVVVDAMFGTGFSGAVRQPYLRVIEWINSLRIPVIAIDIPSGVTASNGAVENNAVRADVTVTMGLRKIGLLTGQGGEVSGHIEVADLGIPLAIYCNPRFSTMLVESDDVRRALPRRSLRAHKYSVGKVLMIAGSKGFTGAAAMAAMSALRAGAGAVMLAVPESVYPILARKVSEPIVVPLPSTTEGSIALGAWDKIVERLDWADVVALGPGLSMNSETRKLVERFLLHFRGNMVIDADGLGHLARIGVGVVKGSRAQIVLTPHAGEFARLTGSDARTVESDRVELARQLARRLACTVVLKGAGTVTATPDGRAYLNSTGNPGMATVGSGDILTGIISGLWAQGMTAGTASYAGVYLHGLAGDLARRRYGERSVVAQDLAAYLAEAVRQVESGGLV